MQVAREFRVSFPDVLRVKSWEHVFVSGSVPQLGSWNPKLAVQLFQSHEDPNIWVGNVELETTAEPTTIQYRYFVAQYLDPYQVLQQTQGQVCEHELIIVSFENRIKPRTFLLDPTASFPDTAPLDHYADYDTADVVRLHYDEGWLRNQSEVRLRLQDTTFWKTRFKNRPLYVKVTPVDLRYREAYEYRRNEKETAEQKKLWRSMSIIGPSVDDEDESSNGVDPPSLPSHTQCLLSVLGEEGYQGFEEQDPFGHFFDETLFHVYRTQTVAPEYLAFRFDFYMGSQRAEGEEGGGPAVGEAGKVELVGVGHLMPSKDLRETRAARTVSITSLKHQPIGQFTVDYLLIHPLRTWTGDLSVSYARHWRKRASGPLDVGHRGLGNSYTKFTGARENTVRSLVEAANHGADFVEFDVQLSKDKIPIVFHDFHICVNVKRRQNSYMDLSTLERADGEFVSDLELYRLGVKDLKLCQLHLLKLDHSSVMEGGRESPRPPSGLGIDGKLHVVSDDALDEDIQNQPFPTLLQVLTHVPTSTGFNVEIKSPLMCLDGTWEEDHFWERNLYVDAILDAILNHAGTRRIVFSSFDPDICTMLKMKQNRYPVLFLTQGKTQRYAPFHDKRANTSLMAVAFAASSNILGVNFHSEELLRDSSPLYAAQNQGLVSFVWGDDLDDKEALKYFRQLQVDGLIYDRIHDKNEGKQNVFLVEKQERDALIKNPSSANVVRGPMVRSESDSSPSPPSRHNSTSASSKHKFNLSPPMVIPPKLSPSAIAAATSLPADPPCFS